MAVLYSRGRLSSVFSFLVFFALLLSLRLSTVFSQERRRRSTVDFGSCRGVAAGAFLESDFECTDRYTTIHRSKTDHGKPLDTERGREERASRMVEPIAGAAMAQVGCCGPPRPGTASSIYSRRGGKGMPATRRAALPSLAQALEARLTREQVLALRAGSVLGRVAKAVESLRNPEVEDDPVGGGDQVASPRTRREALVGASCCTSSVGAPEVVSSTEHSWLLAKGSRRFCNYFFLLALAPRGRATAGRSLAPRTHTRAPLPTQSKLTLVVFVLVVLLIGHFFLARKRLQGRNPPRRSKTRITRTPRAGSSSARPGSGRRAPRAAQRYSSRTLLTSSITSGSR